MYAAVVAKAFRQLVPLTARSHPKEDAIEGFPGINAGASGGFRRILDREHRLDRLPEGVRNDPDGGQRFRFFGWLGHRRLLAVVSCGLFHKRRSSLR